MFSMLPTQFTAFAHLEGVLAGSIESHFKCIQYPHWWLTKCGSTLPILIRLLAFSVHLQCCFCGRLAAVGSEGIKVRYLVYLRRWQCL